MQKTALYPPSDCKHYWLVSCVLSNPNMFTWTGHRRAEEEDAHVEEQWASFQLLAPVSHHTYILLKVPLIVHDKKWRSPQTPRCASWESVAARTIGERCWLTRAKLSQGPFFYLVTIGGRSLQLLLFRWQEADITGKRWRTGLARISIILFTFNFKLFKGGIKTPSLISWYILSVS